MNEIIKNLEEKIRENGPSILTGLGVVGLVSTVGLAIKATHDFDKEEYKTNEDKIKAVLKHYYPVIIFGAGSIACIIGSNSINMKRNLALAGAYKLSESKFKTYKDKLFGEDKKKNDEKVKENVIIFGEGQIDCYDQLTGRYFKCSLSKLHEAINKVNELLYAGELVGLEDFYIFLDMDAPCICEDMVWQQMFGSVKLDLSSKLTDENRPVLVVDFDNRPTKREKY